MPAAVGITLAAQRIDEGSAALVTGTVTDAAGVVLPRRAVVLLARTPGESRWHTIARGRTDAGGSVELLTPGLDDTTRLRLRASAAKSAVTRVVVVPSLSASYADGLIVVTASSARAGETVVLGSRTGTTATATLDESGRASFAVMAGLERTFYGVRLPASPLHATAQVTIAVPPAPTP